jgi:hypothetical protein
MAFDERREVGEEATRPFTEIGLDNLGPEGIGLYKRVLFRFLIAKRGK